MRTCRLSGARVYGPDLGTAVRSSAHNNAAEMATEKRLASALGAGDWPWQTGVVHRLVLGRGSIFADPLACASWLRMPGRSPVGLRSIRPAAGFAPIYFERQTLAEGLAAANF